MHTSTKALIQRNTLAIAATAHRWIDWQNIEQLHQAAREYGDHHCITYGEGSNLVITGDLHPVCLHATDQSVQLIARQKDSVDIAVGAGTHWNWLVHHCLDNGWYGLENLAGIPGSCGAAPIQNIGAYGAELSQHCLWVECFDWQQKQQRRLINSACHFSYRNSRFKTQRQLIVTRLGLRLSTSLPQWQAWQQSRATHASIQSFNEQQLRNPKDFTRAILALRSTKLPDPYLLPNVGSFFHNPIVNSQQHAQLIETLQPQNLAWQMDPKHTKLSAAWLIDRCVGKGYNHGKCGLAAQHALCIVNHSSASGAEIIDLASHIQQAVYHAFAIRLTIEPEIRPSHLVSGLTLDS